MEAYLSHCQLLCMRSNPERYSSYHPHRCLHECPSWNADIKQLFWRQHLALIFSFLIVITISCMYLSHSHRRVELDLSAALIPVCWANTVCRSLQQSTSLTLRSTVMGNSTWSLQQTAMLHKALTLGRGDWR